jgi:hypothetical protein
LSLGLSLPNCSVYINPLPCQVILRFYSKVIHILYPSSLYQSPGRNSIVRLDSCHILLNVNKHTEQLLASFNFETIYSAPSSLFRNRVRKFHTPPPATTQAPTISLARGSGSRLLSSLQNLSLRHLLGIEHPPHILLIHNR